MFQWYSTHDHGAASTVHSYYGSGIADLSWGQLSDWLITMGMEITVLAKQA